jgi:hypothetical protein
LIKSNFILGLLITLSSTVFAQNTFTLSNNDLGGEATINEKFNGFGCTGKINLRNYLGKMHLKELKALQ